MTNAGVAIGRGIRHALSVAPGDARVVRAHLLQADHR
jgi:hypothetical protein